MICIAVLLLITVVTAAPLGAAGIVKARPLSGIGLLFIRGDRVGSGGEEPKLTIYEEPNLGRSFRLPVGGLPLLAPSLIPPPGDFPAIVTARKGEWLRIINDGAERQGWVELRKSWEFRSWEEYLPGRVISMLPGLRKEFYQLRSEAGTGADTLETVTKDDRMQVLKIEGDWCCLLLGEARQGWLRWRDDNGRLTVAVTISP